MLTFFLISCKTSERITSVVPANGILMNPTIKPNAIYRTTMVTDNVSKVEYVGDEDVVEGIKSSGIEYPIITGTNNKIVTTSETGKLNLDGGYSMKSIYESIEESSRGNMPNRNASNGILKQLEGVQTFGSVDIEMNMTIDSIVGLQNEAFRSSIEQGMKAIVKQINYPKEYVQVGDTFHIHTPLAFPVGGGQNMALLVNDIYLLDSITHHIAYFSIDQVITLEVENQITDIRVEGKGNGNIEYDIVNQVNKYYYTELKMNSNIDVGDLGVKTEAITKTTVKVDFELK